MAETKGTLNLKIAPLENRLKVIKQHLILSIGYPGYREKLLLNALTVQSQLDELNKQRQMHKR